MSDPMLPPGSRAAQCPTCKLYFNSPAGFDAHRVAITKGDVRRRCLNVAEMRDKGFSVNGRGYWITEVYSGPHQQGEEEAA
jgi:hypothetical protein